MKKKQLLRRISRDLKRLERCLERSQSALIMARKHAGAAMHSTRVKAPKVEAKK